MSATEEREIEIVAGTIGGITQKKADTWTIQVTPEGSQYAKNLWTKDVELVESLGSKIGQHGTFVGGLGAPYTVNGKEVRSWWIQEAGPEGERVSNVSVEPTGSVATPAAAPQPGGIRPGGSEGMSKEEWRRKDSAADKRALTAIAVSALTHTMPADPSREDLGKFLQRVAHLVTAWHKSIEAERDGEEPPFD